MSENPKNLSGAPIVDTDEQETKEWLDALSAVIDREGAERAHFLIEEMLEHARQLTPQLIEQQPEIVQVHLERWLGSREGFMAA